MCYLRTGKTVLPVESPIPIPYGSIIMKTVVLTTESTILYIIYPGTSYRYYKLHIMHDTYFYIIKHTHMQRTRYCIPYNGRTRTTGVMLSHGNGAQRERRAM